MSLIFPKSSFILTPFAISQRSRDQIKVKITNKADTQTVLPPKFSVQLKLLSLSELKEGKIELAKIIGRSKPGETQFYYKTGQDKIMSHSPALKVTLVDKNTDANNRAQQYSKTQLNLLEMASNSRISATSFMININRNKNQRINCYAFDNIAYRDGIDKKTYIPLFINNLRVIACADSGSDLSIMQLNLFKRLFKNYKNYLKNEDSLTIKSYSDNDLTVLGQCPLRVKFEPLGQQIILTIIIVKDINATVPSFLFGNDSLRTTLATLAYTGDKSNPSPEIAIKNPHEQVLTTYFVSPREIFTCSGEYRLPAYGSAQLTVHLNTASPVIRTDEILISPFNWASVQIMDSKSNLTFDSEKDCFTATAFICNLTGEPVSGIICARFEIITRTYNSHVISIENKNNLHKMMQEKPPCREILPQDPEDEFDPPVASVFNLSLSEESETLSDKEIKDTAGGHKISYTGTAEIGPQIIEGGLEVPTIIHKTPEEAINLQDFDAEIRPYIKKIFLEKYPQVIALHSLDSGDVSKTLGYTTLRLIPGENLPRHRRIYQLSPQDSRYLEELLEQFIRFNFVRRAPVDSTNIHLYGMSTYLVPRKKLTDIARLVIDFSPLTSIIQSPPSIVPDISASLQQLQGKALFSVMDLKYAYLALRICEESKPLTTFLTPGGAYQWLSIPTGAACSPAYFIDAVNRILHHKPVLDENGQPVYDSPNKVRLERDILNNSFHYFDDIICSSELRPTYKETLDYHFECLEKIVYRLAFHGVKLSVNKSEFAKSKVLFLGWIVSHDYVIPDPRRMEKIKTANFPHTKKEVRSFLGLVNSIRRVIPFEVIKEMQILTPLTSSTSQFNINEKHKIAFNNIKNLLLKEPLFCNLIREEATKYLWVDAASSSGCLGAVLAQRIKNDNEKYLPEYINLENKVHRIIYDNNLPYEPCKLYTSFPLEVQKPSQVKTIPPKVHEKNSLYGFNENNWEDSLFWSIISLMVLYNCKIPASVQELRKLATTELKKGILAIKLKDQSFNNNHANYKTFLQEFDAGKHQLDKDLLLAQALAKGLHRCFIFISSLENDASQPIFKFNAESTKPPLIFGIHRVENKTIFTPYFYNKNLEFNIDSLKGKIQIIAYLAKSVPEAYKSRSILDLEALAILTALHSLQRYISNTKCYLLTDSRVLFYLFSQRVGDSSTKIRRWVLKLLSDYPMVTLHFIRTTANLADYLTRQGLPRGDLEKFNIKQLDVVDFYDKLPKHEFTLQEWVKYCTDHPEYLTINNPTINYTEISKTLDTAIDYVSENFQPSEIKDHTIMYSNAGINNLLDLTEPLEILKEKLSRANIIRAQKEEFKDIYTQCLGSDDFEFTNDHEQLTYKLTLDLLMVKENESYKIMVPKIIIGPLLSYTHLLGHQGVIKMIKNLESYYFPTKYTVIKKFISCCYSCFMTHGSSRKSKLGNYPIPEFPFEEVSVDLAESLNSVGGLSHLLIVQCVLSDFILVYPLKSKSAQEVCKVFLYNVLQSFNVSRVHQDNGPCFRNLQWLKLMATLNIQIVNASANNPSSRGKAERAVGQVKTLIKKLLATASSNTLNWELLPFLVSKLMNHTVTPRTGFKPVEMIFGQDKMAQSFLDRDRLLPIHHLVRANKEQITQLTEELKTMSSKAQETLIQLRMDKHEKINKNRIEKHFKPNDIVFVLDRYQLTGNTRPLKTKFFPSPYVVLKPYYTTCLIKRLADGFTALYSMDDIKLYKGTDPIFSTLPPEVTKVLLHNFRDLIDTDFKIILKHDPLDLPTGIPLIDTVDPKIPDESEILNPKKPQNLPEEKLLDPVLEETEPLPIQELDLDIDDEIDELETIEKIEKIPEPNTSLEEKSKIEKPNNQTERVQTRHQTKIQRELNTIEEESEPDSD